MNTTVYLTFGNGTLITNKSNIKLDYAKNNLTHITILDTSKLSYETNIPKNQHTLDKILATSLISVTQTIEQKFPLSFTHYPRLLEDRESNNLLQVVNRKDNRVHISFNDFAFQVKDIKNNNLILVKNLSKFKKVKSQCKKYRVKVLSERTAQYV